MPEFDLFLSHASEDKQTFVLPLAEELDRRGISVWLDRQQLTLGDVLSEKIDEGLARARFGVVVLSHDFFGKQWPRRELDGLVSRETVDGRKVILPIWHGLTAGDVLRYSPTLAAKFAADSHEGITAVADHIHAALRAASNEPPTSSQTNPMPSADNPREFVATDERRPSRDEPLGQVWLVPDTGSELSDVQSLLPLEPAKLPWRVRRAGRAPIEFRVDIRNGSRAERKHQNSLNVHDGDELEYAWPSITPAIAGLGLSHSTSSSTMSCTRS